MTEPIYTDTTERLYQSLPECFRTEDESTNWTLKKFLSSMGDQLDVIDTLTDRYTYVPPEEGPGYRTSDLVDPEVAEAPWMPWLAQLVGVALDTSLPLPEQRATIANSILGIKAGSKAAIAAAAGTVLSGSKEVKVYDHSSTSIGNGGQWDVMLVTKDTETLQNDLPLDQATFASTDGWTASTWKLNLANGAWTTTGMTAATGSTNPLLTNYDTFSGVGNTYQQAVAYAGVKYAGKVMLRATDGLATTADLVMEFMNGGSSLGTTTVNVTGINSNWKPVTVTAVAPANTTHVRLKLVRAAAGVLHVSNKMLSPVGIDIYFDSTFPNVGTDNGYTTHGVVNYWRNGSHDVTGGWLSSNVLLTGTTNRFRYGDTAAFVQITGVSPYISPDYAVPTFEGESIHSSVYVLGDQDGSRARLEIRVTKADATTESFFGNWTDVVDEDFVKLDLSAVSPQNAKSARVYLHFEATTGHIFYVDGGSTLRTVDNIGYFDGNTPGDSWTDANHANAVSLRKTSLPANIVTEDYITRSNALKVSPPVNLSSIKVEMNPARTHITTTAGDPYTFMLQVHAYQAGEYYAAFQAIYYNGSNVEQGRTTVVYPIGTTPTPMVITATIPANGIRTRLRLYIYGANRDDAFGVSQAGARFGSHTDWVPFTADPVSAVIAAGAKPAGVILHHQSFNANWTTIEAAYPTWNDWEQENWKTIEETGL
jgi:hypothetical protein